MKVPHRFVNTFFFRSRKIETGEISLDGKLELNHEMFLLGGVVDSISLHWLLVV